MKKENQPFRLHPLLGLLIVAAAMLITIYPCVRNNSNKANVSPTQQPSQTVTDIKRVARREIVERSKNEFLKGEGTAELTGANDDVLLITSRRLTSGDILGMLHSEKQGFLEIGFSRIIAVGKQGDKQEMDLTK